MKEIKDWNGHHVLAVPARPAGAKHDLAGKERLEAIWALAHDLGMHAESRLCTLCPMHRPGAETILHQCGHPRSLVWTATRDVAQGGCARRAIVAEKYIPLVQMRLGGGS